jgi:hypothetical protein
MARIGRGKHKRGGEVWMSDDVSPVGLLELLLECPDCRAEILQACNSEDRRNVDIDEVLRDLAARGDH